MDKVHSGTWDYFFHLLQFDYDLRQLSHLRGNKFHTVTQECLLSSVVYPTKTQKNIFPLLLFNLIGRWAGHEGLQEGQNKDPACFLLCFLY